MGVAIAGGVASYSSSKTQAKRAKAQGKIASGQAGIELQRSAQSAEEAMLELEDAREYQKWKDEYVTPVVEKGLSDPTQSDPANLRASQNLGRGLEAEEARGIVAQGVRGAGFDIGGSRHQAADADIANSMEGLETATLGAAHEAVKQEGISNTGSLINTGRQIYKQQGIV
jgi:hypothetical protein